ncbi:4'-phosphopantetheinyl transferase superfamily protein [Arthrobacter sp. UKPF54-2]|uniref:4'-phosphopantetheinyl transferase family protein n=1 Tax=Arthrobacter sp. UKPF54-2 TaxID=2600159 RepID=UPI0011B119D8|nr:4'-phosphopantetheinyl transferase superfamily protein [Arthrobacter sp. UKPF54-2]QDY91478.1 4'-phosphopantetheinyl transferase superfamily protein [Arthrobacter sp. UKPF54-2]
MSQLVVRSVPPFRVPGAPGPAAGTGDELLEAAARELLDDVELGRARGMEPRPRQAFVAGRLALRRFAAELLGVPAADLTAAHDCPLCGPGSAHGRPGYTLRGEPVPLLLSLSRSAGWVLMAAVPDPAPGLRLGVDVQDPAGTDFAGFDALVLGPAERAALHGLAGAELLAGRARFWARKEAWLKQSGTGLRTAPDTVEVLEHPGIRDLPPAESGLPAHFAAAVALA